MRITFYNHFGAGDIFESREFVKDLMKIIPADEYRYAHGKNPRILLDIPELKYTEVTGIMEPPKAFVRDNDELYINTWIGRDGQYVLSGIGCVVEMLHLMYVHMLLMLQIDSGLSRKDALTYIPTIDYKYYNIGPVREWVDRHSNRMNVLVCNGPAQSGQAENFDFTEGISMLSRMFPDINIILTSPANIKENNIYFTSNIINQADGFDLNEISYLSKFCRISVGRNSGPHVFSQVMDNWQDPTKINVSLTRKKEASHFVLSNDLPMRKFWLETNNPIGFFTVMESAVKLCL